MKARPVKLVRDQGYMPCKPEEATHVTLWFPGPVGQITVPVLLSGRREGTGKWSWNGSTEKPTLRPSFKSEGIDRETDKPYVCHTWVSDGEASFLCDTTHSLVNQTVPMIDLS